MEFLKIWEILVRRKWLIVSIILLFFFIGFIGTFLTIPVYKSQAKVLIETPQALLSIMSTIGMQSNFNPAALTSTTTSTYDTDIALAQIRPLLEDLISSLSLKDKSGKLLKPDKLVNKTLLERIFPIPHLKISQYKETSIIEIIASSPNPSEAANMANKLAELYINNRTDMTRKEFTTARLIIEGRLQQLRETYINSLQAMRNFKELHGVVEPTVEIQTLMNKIVGLRSSYEENEALIQKYEVGTASAEQKLKELTMFTKQSEQFTSDLIRSLKTRLNDILIELSSKSTDITKEHPDYKKLEKQMAAIKELLMNNTATFINSELYSVDPRYQALTLRLVENFIEREVSVAKRSLFKKYLDTYEAELLKVPAKSVETTKLELDININRSIYQKLLEFLTQVRIAESVTLSKLKVVDSAIVSEKPEFPKKLRNYIISIFLGLFWGVALVFFVEYMDNTIKTPAEIRQLASSTPLGVIPKARQLENTGIISSSVTSPEAVEEAFRTLKNNILFMSAENPVKTITVTSSLKSEGKSSIASNLAVTFGMDGAKVLLLDLNLREPALDRYFKLEGTKGFTDSISGKIALQDFIVHHPAKGIDILLSGTLTSDPGRLIDSPELKEVISTLHKSYDIVIIDTPPIMRVSDAIVIGRVTDGILYVVESGKTTSPMIEYGLSLIKRSGIDIIGFVLNKTDKKPYSYPIC